MVQLREKLRGFQRKYEKIIATRSVFGFSKLYVEAMQKIHEREAKQRSEVKAD